MKEKKVMNYLRIEDVEKAFLDKEIITANLKNFFPLKKDLDILKKEFVKYNQNVIKKYNRQLNYLVNFINEVIDEDGRGILLAPYFSQENQPTSFIMKVDELLSESGELIDSNDVLLMKGLSSKDLAFKLAKNMVLIKDLLIYHFKRNDPYSIIYKRLLSDVYDTHRKDFIEENKDSSMLFMQNIFERSRTMETFKMNFINNIADVFKRNKFLPIDFYISNVEELIISLSFDVGVNDEELSYSYMRGLGWLELMNNPNIKEDAMEILDNIDYRWERTIKDWYRKLTENLSINDINITMGGETLENYLSRNMDNLLLMDAIAGNSMLDISLKKMDFPARLLNKWIDESSKEKYGKVKVSKHNCEPKLDLIKEIQQDAKLNDVSNNIELLMDRFLTKKSLKNEAFNINDLVNLVYYEKEGGVVNDNIDDLGNMCHLLNTLDIKIRFLITKDLVPKNINILNYENEIDKNKKLLIDILIASVKVISEVDNENDYVKNKEIDIDNEFIKLNEEVELPIAQRILCMFNLMRQKVLEDKLVVEKQDKKGKRKI